MTNPMPSVTPRFCSECGSKLVADALFCHECGAPIGVTKPAASPERMSSALKWGFPAFALIALVVLSLARPRTPGVSAVPAGATPLGRPAVAAPDISSMSPEEQADRLFDRVMRLSSEEKGDSAAFFGTMAIGAFAALQPLDDHRRYDMGLVALVTGDQPLAKAQADTILARNPNHLLGLSLAARAADARGDAATARAFRRRIVAAERTERARTLPEYTDHAADLKAAVDRARQP